MSRTPGWALHSIRPLLYTATIATPQEQLVSFQHRSTSGQSMSNYLTTPGLVFLQRNVRNSKFEPFVDDMVVKQILVTLTLEYHIMERYGFAQVHGGTRKCKAKMLT